MELNPKTMNGVEQPEPLQSSVQLQCNLGRPKSKSSSAKSPNASTQLETKTDDSVKKRGKLDLWLLCSEVIKQPRPLGKKIVNSHKLERGVLENKSRIITKLIKQFMVYLTLY